MRNVKTIDVADMSIGDIAGGFEQSKELLDGIIDSMREKDATPLSTVKWIDEWLNKNARSTMEAIAEKHSLPVEMVTAVSAVVVLRSAMDAIERHNATAASDYGRN